MYKDFDDFTVSEEIKIKGIVESYLRKYLNGKMVGLFKSENYILVRESLIKHIYLVTRKEYFKESLSKIILNELDVFEKSGGTFREMLPSGFENNIKVSLYNNSPKMISGVRSMLRKDIVEQKIKEEISKFAGSINPMAAKLINPDSVYKKIVSGVESYFNKPEAAVEFVRMSSEIIDKGMDSELRSLTEYFPFEGRKALAKSIAEGIIKSSFSESAIRDIITGIENTISSDDSTYSVLSVKFGIDLEFVVKGLAEDFYSHMKRQD
ncbi:MAG: hypothetical protein AB9844_11005 [Clostridiaceae bacterium]